MKKTLIINFFGGPCAGKSTQAAGLYYKLKMKGISCELITEYAKDKTWEKNMVALGNQLFVSANQVYRQECVEGQVDVLIIDSPIILGLFYCNDRNKRKSMYYKKLMREIFNEKNNLNIFMVRNKKFSKVGRIHTKEQSEAVDYKIKGFFKSSKIPLIEINSTISGLREILKIAMNKINQ